MVRSGSSERTAPPPRKIDVIVFAHGGGRATPDTFSNVAGPKVRFYVPEGKNLFVASTQTLRSFLSFSKQVREGQTVWTFKSGTDVPDYYLLKSTGSHGDYKKTDKENYLKKTNIENILQETLKHYDIVIVRERGRFFNTEAVTLSQVVRYLSNKGYAHGTIHCFHCRGKPGDEKFDPELALADLNAEEILNAQDTAPSDTGLSLKWTIPYHLIVEDEVAPNFGERI